MSGSPQYDQIRGETAFDNPIYDTAVSTHLSSVVSFDFQYIPNQSV